MANPFSGVTDSGNPQGQDTRYNTPIAQTDRISFYVNLSTLENNVNFSNWIVHLVHADTYTIADPTIVTLTKDTISGTSYRFYADPWIVDDSLPAGCYRIVIIDSVTSNVLYISNILECLIDAQARDETILVRYRNAKNIQNFNYETLTSYYNTCRVRLLGRQPGRQITTEGYNTVDGSFQRIRTSLIKTVKFIAIWLDEAAGRFSSTIHGSA